MVSKLNKNINYLIFIFFSFFTLAATAAPQLSVSSTVEKEITETDENGQQVTRRVEATSVAPGETIFYTIAYSNAGDEAATDVKLDNPIDEGAQYVDGSAWGDGSQILFSVDGQTFKAPAELTYQADGAERTAAPENYSAIRWVIGEIAPGSDGEVGFAVKVR